MLVMCEACKSEGRSEYNHACFVLVFDLPEYVLVFDLPEYVLVFDLQKYVLEYVLVFDLAEYVLMCMKR